MKKSNKLKSSLTNADDVERIKTEPTPYIDARISYGRAYIMERNSLVSVVDCTLEYWDSRGRGWDAFEDFLDEVVIRPGGCKLKEIQKRLHHLAEILRTPMGKAMRAGTGWSHQLVACGPAILLTCEKAIKMDSASIRVDPSFHFPDTDDFIFVFASVRLRRKELIRRLAQVLVDA
jgi:hypothetical protein